MPKDISNLAKDLESIIKKQFKQDAPQLGEQIKAKIQENIVTEVYDKYPDPSMYQRTGGLINSIKSEINSEENNITLDIFNNRQEDGKDIAYLIEHGDENDKGIHYDYPKYNRNPNIYTYLQPRPFMESTVEVMKDDIAEYVDSSIGSAINKLNK